MNDESLNPWLSMWTKPRATIQQIIDSDPRNSVALLAVIAGVSNSLDRASTRSLGDQYDLYMIFAIVIPVGLVFGYVGLYIISALIKWTGKWLGGSAESEHIRAAVAWSNIPIIWALLLWIPALAIFGGELFRSQTPIIDSSSSLLTMYFVYSLMEITIGIWAVVLILKSLSQVQRFSVWRALGNLLLSALVILIPIVAVAVLIIGT